jgi:hypothetical protein
MSFSKTGAIFKIARAVEIDLNQWNEFKKTASVQPTEKESQIKEAIDKQSDFDIVSSVDPEKFIYIHTTIMAGVKTGSNNFWITPETEKFINDNHDSWECDDLLQDYPSFKRALTFVEHNQDLEKARGKCIDAIARKMPDTILVDVLFSVDKKHADLVDNIKNGIINAVSMGCSTEKTICSICGNEAKDQSQYCSHIKNQKGSIVRCSDGKSRRVAELCKGNTFFDVSLVANPAFAGAIFRKILSSEQLGTQLLANLISSKLESFSKDGNTFLKAASIDTEIEIKKDGSVNVKAGDQQIQESLPNNELHNLQSILSNEKSATKFLSKIINKFFNKDSGYHPITNFETDQNNYEVDDEDHSSIPTSVRHEIIRAETEAQTQLRLKEPIEEGTIAASVESQPRTDLFECFHCGHKDEAWQIKAASIDNGFDNVYVCPKCNFISELVSIKKKAFTLTTIDKLQLRDLGFHAPDLKELEPSQIEMILTKSISKKDFEKDPNVSIRRASILKKGQLFIATSDIPVDNDEGTLHFDEHGASVITKNEKLKFVGTVENGEYGFFKTETGEEFFMPTANFKKKVG